MGQKHFTEEQIAFALRQAESGTSVAEIIRKLGISEQTFIGGRSGLLGSASPNCDDFGPWRRRTES
jgi:putative transposase